MVFPRAIETPFFLLYTHFLVVDVAKYNSIPYNYNTFNRDCANMTKSKQPAFSQSFLDKITGLLEDEEKKLKEDLAQFAKPSIHDKDDYDTSFPEYGDDMEENAHEVSEYISNKPLELSMEKTLRDVHTAQERLEKGTYGVCKYCHQPIDEKRLLARPTSSSCVSCKKTLTDEV